MLFFFFFQAEDGIRDIGVTGVQTCALPICGVRPVRDPQLQGRSAVRRAGSDGRGPASGGDGHGGGGKKIGRGSWRGRGEISVGAGSLKKKTTTIADRNKIDEKITI